MSANAANPHRDVKSAQFDAHGVPVYGMDKELREKEQKKWAENGGDEMQSAAQAWCAQRETNRRPPAPHVPVTAC